MVSVKTELLKGARHIAHSINPPVIPPSFKHENVAYFGQWESPELIEGILHGSIHAKNDPKWRLSGARTRSEYAGWSWNMCGMACLKMILAHKTGKVIPIIKLGKLCLKYGGYELPFELSSGLQYQPFTVFLKEEFGLDSRVMGAMVPRDIMAELAKGNYVIASVSPLIRSPKSRPKKKGGHLVLMVGYDLATKTFLLHNPSGSSDDSQAYASVRFRDFSRFFAHRGIVVESSSLNK